MRITLCGSMSSLGRMIDISHQLQANGHQVQIPQIEIRNPQGKILTQEEYDSIRKSASDQDLWVWEVNREAMRDHFTKITWSDAILVPNCEKGGVPGYIGPNTLMEMGLALFLNKKIFLLNPIPDIPSKEEILGIKPIILHGDLNSIS